jgi:MSHA pilin protein MshA
MFLMKVNTQGGFTLIELIVVIIILAILSVFAIPKFIDIEDKARLSVVKAVAGSLRTASALAHALTLANGNGSDSNTDVIMEGNNVAMAAGYPDRNGIAVAVTSDLTPTATATAAVYTLATLCTITYTEATSPNAPGIVTATSGC